MSDHYNDENDNVTIESIRHLSNLSSSYCIAEPELDLEVDSPKMFVGQIPHVMDDSDLKQVFEEFGKVHEMSILREKITNESKGCCFVQYCSKFAADRAREALHNKRVLPPNQYPLQMKIADMSPNRKERKVFVGMLAHGLVENDLKNLFKKFGEIEDCTILRNPEGKSRGCAFLTFYKLESAQEAIAKMHHSLTMEGCSAPINVKLAETLESKREKKRMSLELAQYGLFPRPGYNFYHDKISKDYTLTPPIYPSTKSCGRYIIPPSKERFTSQQDIWNSCDNISSLSNNFENSIKDLVKLSDTDGNQASFKYHTERPKLTKRNTIDAYSCSQQTEKQINGPKNANIFVYNLPSHFRDYDLFMLFQSFGKILSVKVFVDKYTQMSRCFGFVSFSEASSASQAIQALNNCEIKMDNCSNLTKKLKIELKKDFVTV